MSLVLTFFFEYRNWSLGSDFMYNFIIAHLSFVPYPIGNKSIATVWAILGLGLLEIELVSKEGRPYWRKSLHPLHRVLGYWSALNYL